jgi:hypothetical protein
MPNYQTLCREKTNARKSLTTSRKRLGQVAEATRV